MNSHPNLVSSANWQSRDLHSSPVIFLRDPSQQFFSHVWTEHQENMSLKYNPLHPTFRVYWDTKVFLFFIQNIDFGHSSQCFKQKYGKC